MWKKRTTLFLTILFCMNASGVVPIQNFLLGSREYDENDDSDPVYQLLLIEKKNKEKQLNYRMIELEKKALVLDLSCNEIPNAIYLDKVTEQRAKQSFLATVQYQVIDKVMNEILNLAMEIDLSESDFNNLIDHIVNSYCSQNLTTIGHKQLKSFFKISYKKLKKNYKPLKIETNKKINQIITKDKLRAREMNENIHLFRNFCSWEGKPETTDLMSFYISSPHFISAFLKTTFNERERKSKIAVCQNNICRVDERLIEEFPQSSSFNSIEEEFKKIYCSYYQITKKNDKKSNETIKQWDKEETIGKKIMSLAQLVSLYSGLPNYLLRVDEIKEINKIAESEIHHFYDDWSVSTLSSLNSNFFLEEDVELDYIKSNSSINNLHFEINKGELDKAFSISGKPQSSTNIKFRKSFLEWWFYEFSRVLPRQKKKKAHLKKMMGLEVDSLLKQFTNKFRITQDLHETIVKGVSKEIISYSGNGKKMTTFINNPKLKINFYFGFFALQYFSRIYKSSGVDEGSFDPIL